MTEHKYHDMTYDRIQEVWRWKKHFRLARITVDAGERLRYHELIDDNLLLLFTERERDQHLSVVKRVIQW